MKKNLLLVVTALPLLLGSCGESKATIKDAKLETNQTLTIYDHGQEIDKYYWCTNTYGSSSSWQRSNDSNYYFQTLTYSVDLYTTINSITVKLSDSSWNYNGQTHNDQTFTYTGLDLSYRVFTK